ncbi:MAG: RsbRD N-terminal domain-containing protein, partial [Desulfobulbaceae bacterium]|nr:RsbRD N-terminal domain-containing protein [Desulfobulbaceae bacterium]
EILAQKKSDIIQKWIELVLASYSADGASFFMREKDRFANPLGFAAKSGLTKVFDQLIGVKSGQEMPAELRQFIKLRSVQVFTPSAAVSFVYQLKSILIAQLGKETLLAASTQWFELEARIDALALKIFDLYMEDRERLFEVKANEYKNGNHVMAGARCPSNMMGNNQEEKIELKVIRDC